MAFFSSGVTIPSAFALVTTAVGVPSEGEPLSFD
jgi:hypothetical protein